MKQEYASPWIRVFVLLTAVTALSVISYKFNGSILPANPKDALIFQNALLLIVLGSALLEHNFTKPADSVVNSLMGMITLSTVYDIAPSVAWWTIFLYCAIVFFLSVTCVVVSTGKLNPSFSSNVAKFTYKPAIVFGKSRVLFSVVFLFGLVFFYSIQDERTLVLIIFWGLFVALWPLKVPELITSWFRQQKSGPSSIGEITRLDNPNILRVMLNPEANWKSQSIKICHRPNGITHWIFPLFSQFHEDRLLGTGLIAGQLHTNIKGLIPNRVYNIPTGLVEPTPDEITEALGGGKNAELVGFVVEHSSIGSICFETCSATCCHDGMLVWCNVKGERIYYQIVSGETQEESFATDKHGYQVAIASQLGKLNESSGFSKYDWLPAMNTPVFSSKQKSHLDFSAIKEGDYTLGVIPNSHIPVGGDFCNNYNCHTAILGVTAIALSKTDPPFFR